MKLFDTSVWVDYLRARDNPKAALLRNLLLYTNEIAICPPIFQEVLQGISSEKQFIYVKSILIDTNCLEANSYTMSIKAATLYYNLRKNGLTVRKPNDCLIAAYALEFNLPLVHNDKDFDVIAQIYPLKVHNL